jgi:two-component system osmolarity sensor histidine kinase EnvZ
MVSPVSAEAPRRRPGGHRRLRRLLGYGSAALGFAALTLLLLHLLLGRRLQQAQIRQTGAEVAFNLRLMDLALELYSPDALGQITGLRLVVGSRPEAQPRLPPGPAARRLRGQAERLREELCSLLPRCPVVWPSAERPRGVWVEMNSPLETVWLFAPLPTPRGWPPDPLLLSLALVAGGLGGMVLFLTLEVQRPLRQMEAALGRVRLDRRPKPLPERGAGAVRQLTRRFNAMLDRLEQASQERATMLAGIAHDLRSPLTRLRLRLGLQGSFPPNGEERARAEADIVSLERITRQFLLFAGVEQDEKPVLVPLHELVAETAAAFDAVPLGLDLEPVERRVRPTAMARAVANLLDNAERHGTPPLRLVLRAEGTEGFVLEVWDAGPGLSPQEWQRARQPFQRLDPARRGEGHCGLGLAIVERVARDHGGDLGCLRGAEVGAEGFAVVLRGRSLPEA